MNRQDMALSGLNPATQALSGNDLILLTQNTPNGLQSVSGTLAQLLQYLFFGSGETDAALANLGYLKGIYTLNPNSGLIGDGRSSNPMSVNFSYLDTLYVNETDFTNYQNNVNTRFDNVNTQINNINNSISQGVVPNSRNVNTGAGLVGGGNLSADRTISMGVPSSITSGSSNNASGDTHSHELADGSVTNAKLANGAVDTININNGAVTDAKIVSMSASKITGVIPSENLPPASASINVIDNLNSSSVNDALSANQGRVLAEQLVNKLNLSGGTVTGILDVGSGIRLTPAGTADFSNHVIIGNGLDVSNIINAKAGIWTNRVVVKENGLIGGSTRTLNIFLVGDDIRFDLNGSGEGSFLFNKPIIFNNSLSETTISHIPDYIDNGVGGSGYITQFTASGKAFYFNKDVYFGQAQKAANGYTTLPNGLIMQWGKVSDDFAIYNFPIVFPKAAFALIGQQISGGGSSKVYVEIISKSQFKVFEGNNATAETEFYWMAIGY